MSDQSGFVGLHRSNATRSLMEHQPKAFLLLTQIALRARYSSERDPITGLGYGQAQIGDFEKAGLTTESEYRHAKKTLEETGLATFAGTSKGTIATLTNTEVFSISKASNDDHSNEHHNEPTTIQQRSNDEPTTTNNKETNKQDTIHLGPEGPSAEEIYLSYPRKVGKSDALKAIGKAMKKVSSGLLLELTKQYAVARTGEDPKFTPYPSKWFNQGRFNDDPATWRNVDYSQNGGAPEPQRQLSDPNGF